MRMAEGLDRGWPSRLGLRLQASGHCQATLGRRLCPWRARRPCLPDEQVGSASQVCAALVLPSEAWLLAAGLVLQVTATCR